MGFSEQKFVLPLLMDFKTSYRRRTKYSKTPIYRAPIYRKPRYTAAISFPQIGLNIHNVNQTKPRFTADPDLPWMFPCPQPPR